MKLKIHYHPTWNHNLVDEHHPLRTVKDVQLATESIIQDLARNKLSNYRHLCGLHCGEIYGEIILLRILLRVREGVISPDQLEFHFVIEEATAGRDETSFIIPITPDGDFALPFPGGFFSWRDAELF